MLFVSLRLHLIFLFLHFVPSHIWTIFCKEFVGHYMYLIASGQSTSQSLQIYFKGCCLFGHAHQCLTIKVVLWATCCTRFFGFWRSSEFTFPPVAAMFDHMLSVSDVGVDSHSNPSFVSIYLCHTKTDIIGTGTTVYLSRTEGTVCPVNAILAYLALRGNFPGPLFIFQDKSSLYRLDLVRAVWSVLESQGLDIRCFNGHSFHIGAATIAAACCIKDSLIQALGCWKSSAFTTYIPTSMDSLISVSSILLSSTPH